MFGPGHWTSSGPQHSSLIRARQVQGREGGPARQMQESSVSYSDTHHLVIFCSLGASHRQPTLQGGTTGGVDKADLPAQVSTQLVSSSVR